MFVGAVYVMVYCFQGMAIIHGEKEDIIAGRNEGSLFRLRSFRVTALLFFAAFLLYGHTLSFDIVALDDYTLISENTAVLSHPGNIGKLFRSDVFLSGITQFYRPLLNVSLMLDTLAHGPYFFVFHLTNILLHAAAASLVFFLLLRLGAGFRLSAFLALFYLCHPSLAQAVSWVPGRNDSMLSVFILSSFFFLLSYLEKPGWRTLAGYTFFFLAAMFTKETAVVFPFLSLCYMLGVSDVKLPRRAWAAFAAATGAVLGAWALARGLAVFPHTQVGVPRVLSNLPALIVMLGKTVFPYEQGVWTELNSVSLLPGLAALGLFAIGRRYAVPGGKRLMDFGMLWYMVFLLPTIVVIKGVEGSLHLWGHRLALPMAGFLVALSAIKPVRELDFRRIVTGGACAAVLAYFSVCAFVGSYNFSDRITFWKRAAQETPSDPVVYMNLAAFHHVAFLLHDAEFYYRKALEANPNERFAHGNLASIYSARGEIARAEAELRSELKIDPANASVARNLRAIVLLRGKGGMITAPARRGVAVLRIYTEGKAYPASGAGSLSR